MEILEMLTNNMSELLPEDIEMIETELATGTYDDDYIKKCREKLDQIKKWNDSEIRINIGYMNIPNNIQVDNVKIIPNGNMNNSETTAYERVLKKLTELRKKDNYKEEFKKFAKSSSDMTEQFMDNNFTLFEKYEMDALLMVMNFSEDFLNKYFSVLDVDKISKYQLFSEGFFIKHYSLMNAETVLKKGKNPWCDKSKRSSQLDVFLRLKGVKI